MNINENETDLSRIKSAVEGTGTKKNLVNQAITKIIEDGELNTTLKMLLSLKDYAISQKAIIEEVIERVSNNDVPTLDYLRFKYHFLPNETNMTQKDLAELIKSDYLKENVTKEFYEVMKDKSSSNNPKKLKDLFDDLSNKISDLEDIKMSSFGNAERMEAILLSTRDQSNNVYFGSMMPFNHIQAQTGQLIGILGASGHGKSYTLQKLHSESKDDVVLHFSLELPENLFIGRIIMCLGWLNENQIQHLTDFQIMKLKNRLAKEFPDWYYSCLDTDKTAINLSKIEKMIKYYRKKYPNRKIKVFIDYVQLLDELFDPISCKVNKYLHDMAVRYNVCIIEGIQANDDGTKYSEGFVDRNGNQVEGKPPELTHMGVAKILKCDCDIIISQKALSTPDSLEQQTVFTYATKKHRNNKGINFQYAINTENLTGKNDSWKLTWSNKRKDKKVNLINGDHELFNDEDEKRLLESCPI